MINKNALILILFLTFLGVVDAGYLTYEHYAKMIPPCSTGIFIDCGKVLNSKYAVVYGIPVALLGLIHYGFFLLNTLIALFSKKKLFKYFVILQSIVGAFVSTYFMYIQFVIIGSICLYCTLSALISYLIFILAMVFLRKEKKELIFSSFAVLYQNILKNIFFLLNAEFIHERMLVIGEILGKSPPLRYTLRRITRYEDPALKQKIVGLKFESPVGLAAGFDYEAKLPFITPAIGFGFQTVGTITNMPYEGNPKPRLGRLPRSKSLMVNKGFKNEGADAIIAKLENKKLEMPIGISIGRTNSPLLPTLKQSIQDIVVAFKKFESSKVKHKYYELNISCPNIIHGGEISLYPPKNLKMLLSAVERLRIKRPTFIKMPIERTDRETLYMLDIISNYNIAGVIIGNLQKNRKDPSLVKEEVRKWKVGFFSGKPTFNRSNELIRLAYKKFGKKLTIIGCGGIFSAEDTYTKIKLGASLVQLITGMVYQGPQLIAQINLGLIDLLEKDGFKNIKDAVGIDV